MPRPSQESCVTFPWKSPNEVGEAFWRGARYHFQLKAEYLFGAFEAIRGRKLKFRDKHHLAEWASILWSELDSFTSAPKTRPNEDDQDPTSDGWGGDEQDYNGDLAWLRAHGIELRSHPEQLLGKRLLAQRNADSQQSLSISSPAHAVLPPQPSAHTSQSWTFSDFEALKDSSGKNLLWPEYLKNVCSKHEQKERIRENIIGAITVVVGLVPLEEIRSVMLKEIDRPIPDRASLNGLLQTAARKHGIEVPSVLW